MASPTGTITLDKANYAPGQPITITVTHTDADRGTVDFTAVVTGADGTATTLTASATIDGADVTLSAVWSDGKPRSITRVSAASGVSVFRVTV